VFIIYEFIIYEGLFIVLYSQQQIRQHTLDHSLSINRPTKRGKEKCPSDGYCKCKKEMDDHLLACQQIFEKVPHSVTLANERASFLKVNDINDISFLGTPNCHHCCSIA
jgi:hypothetical protein